MDVVFPSLDEDFAQGWAFEFHLSAASLKPEMQVIILYRQYITSFQHYQ